MKKIDEAARKFALMYVDEGSSHFNPLCLAFRGGVRHALNAMTSDAAVKAVDRVRVLRTSTLEQLAAVRKEIEG